MSIAIFIAVVVLIVCALFCLIGFDSNHEQDMERVQIVKSLGADPFVMPFDRHDPYQRRFARWVNNMTAFNSMTWDEWCATFKTPLPPSVNHLRPTQDGFVEADDD